MTRFILPLILIAAAILVFFTFTDAVWTEIGVLKAEKTELALGIDQANKLLARQEELRKNYNAIADDQVARLNKFLPDNIDNVRLIIDMNNIGKFHGLAMRGVSVAGGAESGRPPASPPAGGASEAESGESLLKADSVVISFSISASYEAFKEFLADLSSSLRLLDVASVSMATGETKNLYTFNLGLKTYWLK